MTAGEDAARSGPRHLVLHALLWCGLLLCVLAIARYWDESTTLIRNFTPGSLLVLLAMLLATWSLAVRSWQWIVLAFSDEPLRVAGASRHLAYLVLGKYVPGGVWGFLARLADSASARPTARMLVAGVAEQWISLASLGLVACIALLAGWARQWSWMGAWILVPAASIASFTVLNRLMQSGYRFVPKRWRTTGSAQTQRPASRPLWHAAIASALQQSLTIAIVAWVAIPAYSLDPFDAAAVAGSYGVAAALGILAVVVPGGILVREALFVSFTGAWLSMPQAIALAAVLRLVFTGYDLLSGVLAGAMRFLGEK